MYNELCKPFRPSSFMDKLYPKKFYYPNHGNAFLSFGDVENRIEVWGTDGDLPIEEYDTYVDQPDMDASWPPTATKVIGNITNDNLDVITDASSIDQKCAFDVGTSNLSETAWVARCKTVIGSATQSTVAANDHKIQIGLSAGQSTGENPNEDYIAIQLNASPGNFSWRLYARTGTSQQNSSNIRTVSAETVYAELSRTSATGCKLELFSDAGFSSSLGSATLTITSAINLLKFYLARGFTQTTDGDITLTVDEIEIQDGVSVWV